MDIYEFLHLNFNLQTHLLRQPGERARGPGPREWVPRGSLTVHGGPGAPGLTPAGAVAPHVSRTQGRARLTAGPHLAAAGRARRRPRRHGRRERRARAPMVTAGDHRRGGAAPEREKGRGKRAERSTAHPGTTRAAETTAGAEEDGGAARVDEDGGAPAVASAEVADTEKSMTLAGPTCAPEGRDTEKTSLVVASILRRPSVVSRKRLPLDWVIHDAATPAKR